MVAIVVLIFFGPMKRTVAMTIFGTIDGILAILFVAYRRAVGVGNCAEATAAIGENTRLGSMSVMAIYRRLT
jgi:hypothetical protein